MSRRRPCDHKVGLAVVFAVQAATAARGAIVDPALLIGGSSDCPTPTLVWQHLAPLVSSQVLLDRLGSPSGPASPVQIVDLGSSLHVTVGNRVREYREEVRDCAKRAQFAALFVALVVGADTTAASTPPPIRVDAIRVATPEVVAVPPVAHFRLELGATAGTAFGVRGPTIAPGLALRIALGNRRLIPIAGLTVLAPSGEIVDGIGIRQWQAAADVDLRSAFHAVGRFRLYVELGAAVELLSDRPTNLSVARTQVSYAVGPRAAAGMLLATRGRLWPFLLIHGDWFPFSPELFALPAGDLGQASPWNVGATAGASWGGL